MRSIWQKALKSAADPQRARNYLTQLKQTSLAFLENASVEQAHILVSLLSGSQFLSELLLAHPAWVQSILIPEALKYPRQKKGLENEIKSWLEPLLAERDYATAFAKLRQFKQREMLRIAARDLARIGTFPEIIGEISDVADVSLETILQICWQQLTERFGIPYHLDIKHRWQPTVFCVLGMGKLGGQELNYSSDVDVLFVYGDEGFVFKSPPRKSGLAGKGMTNHQFFIRLSEMFVAEIARLAPEGMLFRIDLRLRPEGTVGPLARSLQSYENYYSQWGQIWERLMLIKARLVAGNQQLAAEFLEMVQPFRYPRSLTNRVFGEITAMKRRIETEVVKAGEMDRNVKLGRGGIREIEFIAQTLQILNAGKTPFLQGAQTIPVLHKLVEYKLLTSRSQNRLVRAYVFLRDVEHRLQMENNQQTHTIPISPKARDRLARLMGFNSSLQFEKARTMHTKNVRHVYEAVLQQDKPAFKKRFPDNFENEDEWKFLLLKYSFKEPEKALRMVQRFVQGPGYGHVSPRTEELARELLSRIFKLCSGGKENKKRRAGVLSDPDRVLIRLDTFINAYGTRSMLYELWAGNPSLFELLVMLFDRSEFFAETAIHTPDLVDELVFSSRLRRKKSSEEILKDLRHGLKDKDQSLWLRRYHQAELMRIGLRDISGLSPFEQKLTALTALADACLKYAVDVILLKNKLKAAPFCIIGLGKLGGAELSYGSDLDILFIVAKKTQNIPAIQKMAVEIIELISAKTEAGSVYKIDSRLRPDGEKGLLVNTLEAYEDYYQKRAKLWEIQSLTRVRSVAGNLEVGDAFEIMAAKLTDFSSPSSLVAYTRDWKTEIARMRQRIEKERTPIGQNTLAIKTGSGGLMDAEFIAQTLCLQNGWQEPNTLKVLQRAKQSGVLPKVQILIDNYRQLRRIESILRRWSCEGEIVLPTDEAPLYRVAVRCGFQNADELMKAIGKWRANIRSVYNKIFEIK